MNEPLSAFPEWLSKLTIQQQTVLMLGSRGPDGISKDHVCKDVVRCYRATIFRAAMYGEFFPESYNLTDKGDSFMSLDSMATPGIWEETIRKFLYSIDELPHHWVSHMMHGAQILGYKYPMLVMRLRWLNLYEAMADDIHLNPETETEMDYRLNDWGRAMWVNS